MASGPRASLAPPVAKIPVAALVAPVVAFLVGGSLVEGSSAVLALNWAGSPLLLTG